MMITTGRRRQDAVANKQEKSVFGISPIATTPSEPRTSWLKSVICRKCLVVLPDFDPLVQVILTCLLIKGTLGGSFDKETLQALAALGAIIAEELI